MHPSGGLWVHATNLPLLLIPTRYQTISYVYQLQKVLEALDLTSDQLTDKLVLNNKDIGEGWIKARLAEKEINSFKPETTKERYVRLEPSSSILLHSEFESDPFEYSAETLITFKSKPDRLKSVRNDPDILNMIDRIKSGELKLDDDLVASFIN
jgi:hypothetical protein